MYTSIVVPLDGSEFGVRALPVALTLAKRWDAKVHLVHVREPVAFLEGETAYEPHLADQQQQNVRDHLTAMAAQLTRGKSLRVDATFLDGPIIPELERYLEGGGHDLVVMTTHGRGGLSRASLGSVADGLIRRAPVPLLLLRDDTEWLRDAVEPLFRRILIPLDGSEMAEEVLHQVVSLGTDGTTEYVLLSVIAPHHQVESGESIPETMVGHSVDEQQRDEAHHYLNGVARGLRSSGAIVKERVEVHLHTAQGILDAAAEHRVDVIALSTHGRGGLFRFLHGSVADKVVREADLPVFAYRPKGAGMEKP